MEQLKELTFNNLDVDVRVKLVITPTVIRHKREGLTKESVAESKCCGSLRHICNEFSFSAAKTNNKLQLEG